MTYSRRAKNVALAVPQLIPVDIATKLGDILRVLTRVAP
jgi:hypothetical protein